MADSSDLIVIASAKAKPGHAKELERALREVRNRPGAAGLRAVQPVSLFGEPVGHGWF
jgi:hypothetical protein